MLNAVKKKEKTIIGGAMMTKTKLEEMEKHAGLKKLKCAGVNEVLTHTCNKRGECNEAVGVALVGVGAFALEKRHGIGSEPVVGQDTVCVAEVEEEKKSRCERLMCVCDEGRNDVLRVLGCTLCDLLEGCCEIFECEQAVELGA